MGEVLLLTNDTIVIRFQVKQKNNKSHTELVGGELLGNT